MSFSNPTESGKSIKIKDEGVLLTGNVASIDFVGSGVTGSVIGNDVTETITGGGPATELGEVVGEVPTGDIDGVNETFVVVYNPFSGTTKPYLNGIRLKYVDDYTVIGKVFTLTSPPDIGSKFFVDYFTNDFAGSGTHVTGEVPSGTVDGVNDTFTLAHTPTAGTLKLFVGGVRLKETDDYTLSTNTITFITPPQSGSNILADYTY